MENQNGQIDPSERDAMEAERRELILALPPYTLVSIGWEVEPGRVQGSLYMRVGDGLRYVGPMRDDDPGRSLRDQCRWGYRPGTPWGFSIVAPEPSRAPLPSETQT
jgi:hypothetical protein